MTEAISPLQQRLYDALVEMAERGRPCPPDRILAEKLKCSRGALPGMFQRLQMVELIEWERSSRGVRWVRICSTGKSTARHPVSKYEILRQQAFSEAEAREKRFIDAASMSRTRIVDDYRPEPIYAGWKESGVCWHCGSRLDACECGGGTK